MYQLDKFTANRPREDVAPNKKSSDPTYCRDWSRFIYSYGLQDRDGVFANKDLIAEARAYFSGTQTIERYMDVLDPKEAITKTTEEGKTVPTGEFARKGYSNINWQQLPIMSKFGNIFVARLMKRNYDITCDAIDEFSEAEKSFMKERAYVMAKERPFIQQVEQKIGLQDSTPEYEPQSRDELEMYFELGGMKLAFEEAMEECLGNDFNLSDYDTEIAQRLAEDIFNLNKCATLTYVDDETQQTRVDYVDVGRLIIQYSRYRNYKNAQFAGLFVDYTVNELRPYFTEEELYNVVTQFNGKYSNDELTLPDLERVLKGDVECNYNSMIIPVLKTWWVGCDYKFETVKEVTNPTKRELDSYKFYEKGGKYFRTRKVSDQGTEMVYQSNWVIGTDLVFDFGKMENQIRPTKNKSLLPITCHRFTGMSLNRRIQPHVDQLHLHWYKYQNANATAANDGYFFELDMLNATAEAIGGWRPMDLLKIRRQGSGDIVGKLTTHSEFSPWKPTGVQPIIPMPGGMGKVKEDFLQMWSFNLSQIQFELGIAQVDAADQGAGDTPVRTQQMLKMATDDAMAIYVEGFLKIKEMTAIKCAYRIQLLITYNKDAEKSYKAVIGEESVQAIKELEKSNRNITTWGIGIASRPTDDEKNQIREYLNKIVLAGRDGKPATLPSAYFSVLRVLDQPNGVKKAEMQLAFMENKMIEQSQKQAQEAIMVQAQEAQKTEALKKQAEVLVEQEKAKIEMQKEMAIYTHKINEDIRFEKETAGLDVRKNIMQGAIDSEVQRRSAQIAPESGVNMTAQPQNPMIQPTEQPIQQTENQ